MLQNGFIVLIGKKIAGAGSALIAQFLGNS